MLARNPWSNVYGGQVSFADMAGRQSSWTADRTEFIGRSGSHAAPASLLPGAALSGKTGAGFDPCAALQTGVELDAGETAEIVFFMGQCGSVEDVRSLVTRYRAIDLDAVFGEVTAHWREMLGAVQVRTPDRAMDIMLNGWLLYQTLACRVRARSAFYQASGAYGFRDQLQDGMALTFSHPQETRGHLLVAASRQFVEGDVQHWWLPQSGQGVRTRISDDRVWLAFASATYVACSGDTAVLDEMVPFLEGAALASARARQVLSSDDLGDIGHPLRALRARIGSMPRADRRAWPAAHRHGDWNDGMNRVGEGGAGESVWLGWLLLKTIELFAPLAERRKTERDAERARTWRSHADRRPRSDRAQCLGWRLVSSCHVRRRHLAGFEGVRGVPHRFDRPILGGTVRRSRSGTRRRGHGIGKEAPHPRG